MYTNSSYIIYIRHQKSMKQGFTLIEMIISITIMLLLLGVTIVGYTSYNDKQKVKQAASALKSDLRMARTNATSGKKPLSCTAQETFVGYEIIFASSFYSMTPRCSDSGLIVSERNTIALPPGVSFDPIPSSFTYYSLMRGVSTPPGQIILTDGINSITLSVDSSTGEISNEL